MLKNAFHACLPSQAAFSYESPDIPNAKKIQTIPKSRIILIEIIQSSRDITYLNYNKPHIKTDMKQSSYNELSIITNYLSWASQSTGGNLHHNWLPQKRLEAVIGTLSEFLISESKHTICMIIKHIYYLVANDHSVNLTKFLVMRCSRKIAIFREICLHLKRNSMVLYHKVSHKVQHVVVWKTREQVLPWSGQAHGPWNSLFGPDNY